MKRPTPTPNTQTRHLQRVLTGLADVEALHAAAKAVMAAMEQRYAAVADSYGFTCSGCEESCCRTLFYHHTYTEFMLLSEGLQTLTLEAREAVFRKAGQVKAQIVRHLSRADAGPPHAMCPLNQDGRCILYLYRPMICRLHGVPHHLQRPDGRVVNGPGCHQFDAHCEDGGSRRLDRTPCYQQFAQVEQGLRSQVEAPMRLRMTLAEWLWALADGAWVPGPTGDRSPHRPGADSSGR